MPLKNKTIVIISPQAWGSMFISKHHYAITLARLGNQVYFLNPPVKRTRQKKGIHVLASGIEPGLFLIDHSLRFPFVLKFHAIWLFHWLMAFHIKDILKRIGRETDIIWSFDQGNLYPFRLFGKKPFKIFQPVDEPANSEAIRAATGSQVILSVTKEILAKYSRFTQPQHLINHGIGEDFLSVATVRPKKTIHVGFSGNLLRPDIDRKIFLAIIDQHPDFIFECWGAYIAADNNIGGAEDLPARSFIQALQQRGVILHGPTNPVQLAAELQRMDVFLICYDINKDQSKGTNYHKIMEYLSTGKVVIANNITAYQNRPAMVQMILSRKNNNALPRLFKKIVQNLDYYNNSSLQSQRKEYAALNTYVSQVDRIEKIIEPIAAGLKDNRLSIPVHSSPLYSRT